MMNGNTSANAYRLAARTALVAGIIAIVVCALLLYDYTRRLVKDPLDSAAFQTLVAALDQQPTSDTLKTQIRDLDVQLRREYFRQRAFAHAGAALLIGAVAVFLAAAKTAVTLRRRLPAPGLQQASADREAAWTQVARWAVAATCLIMIGVAITLAVSVRSPLDDERDQLAAIVEPPATPIESNSVADTPPSDKQWHANWPRFRGPDGLGVSAYTDVPGAWDGTSGKGIVWKTPVPLPGNNSPIVWGRRVFLSGADARRREVYCFDADNGKLLWQEAAPGTPQSTATTPKVMDETGYAAPTTATDGQRVFAIFANGDLAALDFSGKLAWSKSLGIPENSYGHASSLAMYRHLLLVQFDQGSSSKTKSKLLAFESASGKLAWQVDRPMPNSWSTPIVIRHAERDQIITTADPWVIAYDAATGAEIWRAKCLRTDIGPSPTFAEGKVFAANDNCELSVIRADGRGDVTATGVLWKGEDGLPDTCSPLATKEFVFLLTSYGTLTCYDADKGGVLWSEDFEVEFSASPSLVGDRVYLIGKSGKAWILQPTREKCARVGEADLGEECVTSPAFQQGRIYLRGKNNLFCIGPAVTNTGNKK